jgi:hypothetical protein
MIKTLLIVGMVITAGNCKNIDSISNNQLCKLSGFEEQNGFQSVSDSLFNIVKTRDDFKISECIAYRAVGRLWYQSYTGPRYGLSKRELSKFVHLAYNIRCEILDD